MTGILSSTIGTLFKLGGISVNNISQTNIKTAGTNNLTSGSVNLVAGRIYVVLLAWDPSGNAVPTVTLSDGANTYTSLGPAFTAPATTSAGNGIIIQSFTTSVAITATRTITATFSASITAKCMMVFEVIGGTQTERNTETSQRGTTGDPSYTSPSANIGDLIFSVVAQETPIANAPTTGPANTLGVWSNPTTTGTTGGNAATNIMISYEYTVATSAGTQTIGWTLPATTDWASQTFVLQAAV